MIQSVDSSCLLAAKRLHQAGFSLLPIKLDGSKEPNPSLLPRNEEDKPSWDELREKQAPSQSVERWFRTGENGIGVAAGRASGNLLILDFETQQSWKDFQNFAKDEELAHYVDAAPLACTPGQGFHLYLRGPEAAEAVAIYCYDPNQKTPKANGLIAEMKPKGYVIAPGSPEAVHSSKRMYAWNRKGWLESGTGNDGTLPAGILPLLLGCFKKLHKGKPAKEKQTAPKPIQNLPAPMPEWSGTESVSQQFNRENSLQSMLEADGWKPAGANGTRGTKWTRPGKDRGCSATLSPDGKVLWNFSTSADIPASETHPTDAFEYYAATQFAGNKSEAAKAYLQQSRIHDPRIDGYFTGATPRQSAANRTLLTDEEQHQEGFRPFPVDEALPPVAARFTKAVAKSLGVDEAHVGAAVASVMGGAVGRRRLLRVSRTYREPAGFWLLTLGRPGLTKTAPLSLATKPLMEADEKQERANKAAWSRYQQHLELWKREAKTAAKDGDSGILMRHPPEPPPQPAHVVTAATLPGVVDGLADSPMGLTMVVNDAGDWLDSFARHQAGKGTTQDGWLQLDDGDGLYKEMLRKGRKTLKNPRLSVLGNIQPGRLAEHLNKKTWGNGFAQRLLLVSPPGNLPDWDDANEADQAVIDEWNLLVNRLLELTPAGLDGVELFLATDARKAWVDDENRRRRNQRIAACKDEGRVAELLSKHRKLTLRHALAYHCCLMVGKKDEGWQEPVSLEAVQAGIAFADWISLETLRVHQILADTPANERSKTITRHLERYGPSTASMIFANHKSTLGNMESLWGELEILLVQGAIEAVPTKGAGRPTHYYKLIR